MYSLESPHRGDSNEYTQHTIIFFEDRKHFHKLSSFASWPGAMIKSHWLQLPISRTNFHGPKDVRAIEVWLYTDCNIGAPFISATKRSKRIAKQSPGRSLSWLDLTEQYHHAAIKGMYHYSRCSHRQIFFFMLRSWASTAFSVHISLILTILKRHANSVDRDLITPLESALKHQWFILNMHCVSVRNEVQMDF